MDMTKYTANSSNWSLQLVVKSTQKYIYILQYNTNYRQVQAYHQVIK